MHFYYIWKSLKFTLKHTSLSLLRVSVYDHPQGACTEPGESYTSVKTFSKITINECAYNKNNKEFPKLN